MGLIDDVKYAARFLDDQFRNGPARSEDEPAEYFFEYLSDRWAGSGKDEEFVVEGKKFTFELVENIVGENGGADQNQVWLVRVDGEPVYVRSYVYYDSWDGADFSNATDYLAEVFPATVREEMFLMAHEFEYEGAEFRDTGVEGLSRP